MANWHCTQKGRVVYDRRPTAFAFKDVTRILQKIESPGTWEFAEKIELLQILLLTMSKLNFGDLLLEAIRFQSDLNLFSGVLGGIEAFVDRTMMKD